MNSKTPQGESCMVKYVNVKKAELFGSVTAYRAKNRDIVSVNDRSSQGQLGPKASLARGQGPPLASCRLTAVGDPEVMERSETSSVEFRPNR